jgi:hypothetical protein
MQKSKVRKKCLLWPSSAPRLLHTNSTKQNKIHPNISNISNKISVKIYIKIAFCVILANYPAIGSPGPVVMKQHDGICGLLCVLFQKRIMTQYSKNSTYTWKSPKYVKSMWQSKSIQIKREFTVCTQTLCPYLQQNTVVPRVWSHGQSYNPFAAL